MAACYQGQLAQQFHLRRHRFQYPGGGLQPVSNEASGRGAQGLHLGQHGADTIILDAGDNGCHKLQDRVSMVRQALKGSRHRLNLTLGRARQRLQFALCLLKSADNFCSGFNAHRDLSCQRVSIPVLKLLRLSDSRSVPETFSPCCCSNRRSHLHKEILALDDVTLACHGVLFWSRATIQLTQTCQNGPGKVPQAVLAFLQK